MQRQIWKKMKTRKKLRVSLLAGCLALLVGGIVGFIYSFVAIDGYIAEIPEQWGESIEGCDIHQAAARKVELMARWQGLSATIGAAGALFGLISLFYPKRKPWGAVRKIALGIGSLMLLWGIFWLTYSSNMKPPVEVTQEFLLLWDMVWTIHLRMTGAGVLICLLCIFLPGLLKH